MSFSSVSRMSSVARRLETLFKSAKGVGIKPDGEAATNVADIAFLFHVTVEGAAIGDFQAVENLQRTVEVKYYFEGGRNHAPHALVNPAKWGEVTLRWGMMSRDYLWKWANAVQVGLGKEFRRDVQIYQLNRKGQIQRTYKLIGAWPVAYKGAQLDSSQSRMPVEEVQLAYDYMEMEVKK